MTPEMKTEVPAEVLGEVERSGHARLIAIAAVVTTLFAAVTAFMQASALRIHDQSATQAARLSALSLNAGAGNKDQAQVQIELYRLVQAQRRQAANAEAFSTFGGQASAGLEAARWQQVAARTATDTTSIAAQQHLIATCSPTSLSACFSGPSLPAICSPTAQPRTCGTAPGRGGWYSAELDPSFPKRYEQAAAWESYFLSARRDAANERGQAAETRFVHLAAALTLFAVAVFLFGYSLTPQGERRRRLFAGAASAFVVAGALWAVIHIVSRTPDPPLAAARAYADGEVALNDGDYRTAVGDLQRVTQMRPKFVDAWGDLAQALYSAGTPSALQDNEQTQIPSVASMKLAMAADRSSIDAGSDSPLVRFDLGANELYMGLLTHDDAMVRDSRAYSDETFKRFRTQSREGRYPGDYRLLADFNRAEADLAVRSPLAPREYGDAAALMTSLAKAPDIYVEGIVGAALTDLNLIAQTRPALSAQADAMAREVVAKAETTWGGAGKDLARFSGVTVAVDPAHLQFTIARAAHFDTTKDLLSAQWEYRDRVNGNWEVLSDASGPLGPDQTAGNITSDGGAGYYSDNPSFMALTSPHTCLPAGQYRVRLWVNGRVAGTSAVANSTWGGTTATGFRGINALFCRPAGWTGSLLGAGADAFTSADHKSGAAIFVVPKAALGVGADPVKFMHTIVSRYIGAGGPAAGASPTQQPQDWVFMNFRDAKEQIWQYPAGPSKTGQVVAGVGTAPDNELYVGVAYGVNPSSSVDSLQYRLENILLSYTEI